MQVGTLITAKFVMSVSKVRRTSDRESISDHRVRMSRSRAECDSAGPTMRKFVIKAPYC